MSDGYQRGYDQWKERHDILDAPEGKVVWHCIDCGHDEPEETFKGFCQKCSGKDCKEEFV